MRQCIGSLLGPLYQHGLTFFPTRESNHIIKCAIKLLIHAKTSTAQSLKLENWQLTASNTLLCIWIFIRGTPGMNGGHHNVAYIRLVAISFFYFNYYINHPPALLKKIRSIPLHHQLILFFVMTETLNKIHLSLLHLIILNMVPGQFITLSALTSSGSFLCLVVSTP